MTYVIEYLLVIVVTVLKVNIITNCENMVDYLKKCYILFRFFIDNLTKKAYYIDFIEKVNGCDNVQLHIKNRQTRKFTVSLPHELYNNKKLLNKFSKKDAAVIGFYYGRNYPLPK